MDKIFSFFGRQLTKCILEKNLEHVLGMDVPFAHINELIKREEYLKNNNVSFSCFNDSDKIEIIYQTYPMGMVYFTPMPKYEELFILQVDINRTYFTILENEPEKWKHFLLLTGGYFFLNLFLFHSDIREFFYHNKHESTLLETMLEELKNVDYESILNEHFKELEPILQKVRLETVRSLDYDV